MKNIMFLTASSQMLLGLQKLRSEQKNWNHLMLLLHFPRELFPFFGQDFETMSFKFSFLMIFLVADFLGVLLLFFTMV